MNYALYPHMTVFANMAYSLKIAGLRKKEIEGRIATTARLLELRTISQAQAGIRPEHLRICAPGSGIRDAKIAFFEELGAETLIHLTSAHEEKYILRLESTAQRPALGTTVGLIADPRNCFFFDEGGKRLADVSAHRAPSSL